MWIGVMTLSYVHALYFIVIHSDVIPIYGEHYVTIRVWLRCGQWFVDMCFLGNMVQVNVYLGAQWQFIVVLGNIVVSVHPPEVNGRATLTLLLLVRQDNVGFGCYHAVQSQLVVYQAYY